MSTVPIWFIIHIYATFGLYIACLFTGLMMHVFSFLILYLGRSYVSYRWKVSMK
ncbi:respiratory nitrate reductase subunit gamma [Oceanobacillus chungangensis]|uniref:NarG-like domain-containing protein n=1 Tax=Oceanobacillus chungangensis TaxID=1229152 RepID=A0A3D8PIC9_9BACI|nr:hypothetical protein CWR45_16575 [Oceanobacillus chungangensis]